MVTAAGGEGIAVAVDHADTNKPRLCSLRSNATTAQSTSWSTTQPRSATR
jgi:hypothetical protein